MDAPSFQSAIDFDCEATRSGEIAQKIRPPIANLGNPDYAGLRTFDFKSRTNASFFRGGVVPKSADVDHDGGRAKGEHKYGDFVRQNTESAALLAERRKHYSVY